LKNQKEKEVTFLKWKFWQKDASKDETTIQVTTSQLLSGTTGTSIDIYVTASTSEKALELFD